MEKYIFKEGYKSKLTTLENEVAIKKIREFFEENLASEINLTRVTAPLLVLSKTGINDDLSGKEVPVRFKVNGIDNEIEIVHSLAKWKRMNIAKYGFNLYQGLYTDMDAIRKDENLDNYHSLYVDQWDYEVIINKEDRNVEFLKEFVDKIYKVIKKTEEFSAKNFNIEEILPNNITFINSEDLLDLYPLNTPEERVDLFVKEKKAIFVKGIGYKLKNGLAHDHRAPDYDDWNLNGDIFVYNPILDNALELSSMGIRVDKEALINQVKLSNKEELLNHKYQQGIINETLPFTIGGGIGQSRICMFMLKKLHIGEVQSSIWSEQTRRFFKEKGVEIL